MVNQKYYLTQRSKFDIIYKMKKERKGKQ